MIKLKPLYEIKVVKPLKLNAKGQQLIKDYDEFNRLVELFDITAINSNDFEGNDDYNYVWDIQLIVNTPIYSNKGTTNIELLKQYLINERYGEWNELEEDEKREFEIDLKYYLTCFS